QRVNVPKASGVSAPIKAYSSAAKTATATAPTENTRFARAARSFHQTMNCRNASVMHAPAPSDQTTVTQLIISFDVITEERSCVKPQYPCLCYRATIRLWSYFESGRVGAN